MKRDLGQVDQQAACVGELGERLPDVPTV